MKGMPHGFRRVLVIFSTLMALSGCSMLFSYTTADEEIKERVEWGSGNGDMQQAIIVGANAKGWVALNKAPNVVSLRLELRGNVVDVDVYYGKTEFLVKYKDSVNMDYDPSTGNIHGKYITWIRCLKQSIKNSAKRM